MKRVFRFLLTLFFVTLLAAGCGPSGASPSGAVTISPTAVITSPGYEPTAPDLSPAARDPVEASRRTLASLKKVDGFPLYTMTYYGDYDDISFLTGPEQKVDAALLSPAWGCSLFVALGNQANQLYGRNFDWEFSPAMLLFTHPTGGYASVSMVDLAYMVDAGDFKRLTDLPLESRQALLEAPRMPFDGMNEAGVAIGMAAVPAGNVPRDPARRTIGSIRVIREVLDHAGSVDEGIAIFQKYNLEWGGGPTMHYLLADRSGSAVLIEYSGAKMALIRNTKPWLIATNFLVDQAGDRPEEMCWRYQKLSERLTEVQGQLTVQESMHLLSAVSQTNTSSSTQWSVVYAINTGEVHVVVGRQYDKVLSFSLTGAP